MRKKISLSWPLIGGACALVLVLFFSWNHIGVAREGFEWTILIVAFLPLFIGMEADGAGEMSAMLAFVLALISSVVLRFGLGYSLVRVVILFLPLYVAIFIVMCWLLGLIFIFTWMAALCKRKHKETYAEPSAIATATGPDKGDPASLPAHENAGDTGSLSS